MMLRLIAERRYTLIDGLGMAVASIAIYDGRWLGAMAVILIGCFLSIVVEIAARPVAQS